MDKQQIADVRRIAKALHGIKKRVGRERDKILTLMSEMEEIDSDIFGFLETLERATDELSEYL